MEQCPCGSGKPYAQCCEPYHNGTAQAPTALALMRSRYTAYVKGEIDYLVDTHDPTKRSGVDREATRTWAEESEWLGLDIIRTEGGAESDSSGVVEFVAHYRQDGEEHDHAEVSTFVQRQGQWYFSRAATPSSTVVRDSPKVGRNDPCPCGSGKKYKKCCGA